MLKRIFKGDNLYINKSVFSPDGTTILTIGAEGIPRLWDTSTGEKILDLIGHSYPVNSADFSPDGSRILTGDATGESILWNAATGVPTHQFPDPNSCGALAVAFFPNGTNIATGGCGAHMWDVDTESIIHTCYGRLYYIVNSIAISPDGTKILTGSNDQTATLYNVDLPSFPAEEIRTFSGHNSIVQSVDFLLMGNMH